MLKFSFCFVKKGEFTFSATTSTNTSGFIHTSNFILKQKKQLEVSDKCHRTHKEIQHKLITLLVCSAHVKLFLLFGHNMKSLCSVMMKIVPFLVWTECVSCSMFLSVVSSMYFSWLWKWRVIASVVRGFGGDGRYTPPLVHGLALLGQSCVPKILFSCFIFLSTNLGLRWILRKARAWEAQLTPSASWSY